MTDKIVFIVTAFLACAGLMADSYYWQQRAMTAEAAQVHSDGRTAACLSGTLRLIWEDGSVTRSVPARHYERMLMPSEMDAL